MTAHNPAFFSTRRGESIASQRVRYPSVPGRKPFDVRTVYAQPGEPIELLAPNQLPARLADQTAAAQTMGQNYRVWRRSAFDRGAWFGFGDASFVLIGAILGLGLEERVAKRIKVRGLGPMVGGVAGAAVGNTLAASHAFGREEATGMLVGSALPLIPLAAAAALKKPLQTTGGKPTPMGYGVLAALVGAVAFNVARRTF